MVDPWRHLNDWNKPSNKADSELEAFFQEAKTEDRFRRHQTSDLAGQDCRSDRPDHRRRVGFCLHRRRSHLEGHRHRSDSRLPQSARRRLSGWRRLYNNTRFEPTLVFPFAGYFAEAVGATIYALPHSQFCLQKTSSSQFAFIDITGHYDDVVGLQTQFAPEKLLKLAAGERFPRLLRVARKIRGLLPGLGTTGRNRFD
jgi:hypothetical protein